MFGYSHEHMKVCHWMEDSKQPFAWYAFIGFLYCIWYWLQAQRCRFQDHVISDNSFVGPDTGYESLHCTRCGWEHHHTYY